MQLVSATIQAPGRIILLFDRLPEQFDPSHVTFSPALRILSWDALELMVVLDVESLDVRRCHTVIVRNAGVLPVLPDGIFMRSAPRAPLGCTRSGAVLTFRVFAPRAQTAEVVLMHGLDDGFGTSFSMTRTAEGVWECAVEEDPRWYCYVYRFTGATGCGMSFGHPPAVADPWARAVVTRNTFRHEARALLPARDDAYDWGDDAPIGIAPQDLVIYEMHVRDMTAHPSSGAPRAIAGTYAALARNDLRGGIAHLRRLGVNAVELLPTQHFAWIEPPYHERTEEGFYNTWNPNARNHWGYMTSYYFAPEPTFATGATMVPGEWNDTQGRQIREFRDMVRALHRAGLAVIMDVVYNHASQYDQQPLGVLDEAYWFHLDAHGERTSLSGCGNDLNTGRPLARRLVVESIEHWMREFHVDGFRFDLAALIDHETMEEACRAARSINPDVILIAEPWGGGRHDIPFFSSLGMGAWNDVFRNGVKGWHPRGAQGYAFGTWGGSAAEDFGKWVLGSSAAAGGPFADGGWPVNYLEAHDGYTLGDFIRIAVGAAQEHVPVADPGALVVPSCDELQIHRLAAFLLFVSQGAVMVHEGQEFARAKIIAASDRPDISSGVLDHNSYDKDDATNWLDYTHADANAALVDWYAALIRIRAAHPQLRKSPAARYLFLSPAVALASGFILGGDRHQSTLAVLVNANHHDTAVYHIPAGTWSVLVDGAHADPLGTRRIAGGAVTVVPCTGMLLRRDDQENQRRNAS